MNFIQQIQIAFFSVGPERAEAEKVLVNMRAQDPTSFFTQSGQLLFDQNQTSQMRQAASTLIKLSVLINPGPDKQDSVMWYCVDPNVRKGMKDALIDLLMNPDIIIRKAAAVDIAFILVAEYPRGEWNDLIGTLYHVTQQTNAIARQSAIQTLGFICEQFKEVTTIQLTEDTKQSILMSIVIAIKQEQTDIEMKKVALKALSDALPFLDKLFDTDNVLQFVSLQLCQCIADNNPDVKSQALQTTIDYFKVNYLRLQNYIKQFFSVTQGLFSQKDSDFSILAIEIWDSICQEYLTLEENEVKASQRSNYIQSKPIPNHITQVYQELVLPLLNNLVDSDKDDEDLLTSLMEASYRCLVSITQVLKDLMVVPLSNYLGQNLQDQRWNHKVAGLLTFNVLIESQLSESSIGNLITQGFQPVVNQLEDNNKKVKEAAAKLVSNMAENYHHIILNCASLPNDLVIITKNLQSTYNISKHLSWFFVFLSEDMESMRDNAIQRNANQIIQSLIQNAFRHDIQANQLNLIDIAFMGIVNILQKCADKQITTHFCLYAIQEFQSIGQVDQLRKSSISGGLQSILHASLLNLSIDNYFLSINQWEPISSEAVKLVITSFQNQSDVDSDGMYVISSLATAMRGKFKIYLEQIWPFIVHALQKQNNADIFKSTIGALADIARACEEDFQTKINVLDSLFECLLKQEFDRELKLQIFLCIGDIFLACRECCIQYLPNFIQILQYSLQGCVQLHSSALAQDKEYAEQLQDRLIEAFTCLIHAYDVNQPQPQSYIQPVLPALIEFIEQTTTPQRNPTIEFCRNSLALIADIGNIYNQVVKQLICRPSVQNILQILQKYDQNEDNKSIANYTIKVLQKINSGYQ